MQFLPTTFAAYGVDGDGDGRADITNPVDAVYSAANYLCASGARGGVNIPAALWKYNHDNAYVARVLTIAATYSEPTSNSSAACPTFQSTVQSGADDFSSAALVAVTFACAQIGKPYVWGGNGDPGFDCSGLTHAAYAAVGISIPRTAQTQYDAGPRLAGRTPLAPGDLVFYGTSPTTISHVGVYTGGTRMIDAPHTGAVIRDEDYRWPTFIGATRPAATR